MQQIDEFVHSIYGAILDNEKWKVALAQLANLADAPRAALLDSDLAAGVTHREIYFGMDDAENRRYLTEYAAIDPRLPVGLGHNKLTWLSDLDLFDEAFRKKERIYTEFLVPRGVGESIFGMFSREGPRVGTALLARDTTQPKVVPAVREVLDLAMPHLDRAVMISRRFEALAAEIVLSQNVLDALAEPLACVLSDGKMHRANRPFEDLLREGKPLSVSKELLRLKDAKLQARFLEAVQECCRIAEGGTKADPNLQLIIRIDHASAGPTFITVAPLAAAHFRSWAGRPCALVRVDQSGGVPDSVRIAEALGLSMAESRLVCALCAGGTLADAADKLGISLNTAKTQLSSAFSKTGTARQSELVVLVAALPRKA